MTESKFYKKAAKYWANVPATIDGVLGGFGHISDIDLEGSRAFLKQILSFRTPPATTQALDCGAGIGRVSKYILIPQFEKVDLVEQDEKFINTARQFIGVNNAKLGSLYKIGLQNYKPHKKYDVIWCQWVLGHLKDYDLVDFLEICSGALNDHGVLVVKENIATSDVIEYDEDDSSVTRPYALMEKIFDEAKLKVVITDIQKGFPDDIYPVNSFALIPM